MRIGWPCLFHLITGLYCPGCGGTRSAIHLIHGDIIGSLVYHPLVLYMVVVVLIQLAGALLAKVKHNPIYLVKHYQLFAFIGLGIVVVNCLVKNYMLVVRGIDLLP